MSEGRVRPRTRFKKPKELKPKQAGRHTLVVVWYKKIYKYQKV
jgi:hypothetical protein